MVSMAARTRTQLLALSLLATPAAGDVTSLCTTNQGSRGWMSACVGAGALVCSVRIYNSGTAAQMGSLSRGVQVFVGDSETGR